MLLNIFYLSIAYLHLLLIDIRFHSSPFVAAVVVIHYHSLYLSLSLVIIPCHLLSFVIIRCHWLSLIINCCHSLYHSLSLILICCHSMSFDVPLVYLFINDHLQAAGFVIHITISFTILITVLIIQTIFLYRTRRDFM